MIDSKCGGIGWHVCCSIIQCGALLWVTVYFINSKQAQTEICSTAVEALGGVLRACQCKRTIHLRHVSHENTSLTERMSHVSYMNESWHTIEETPSLCRLEARPWWSEAPPPHPLQDYTQFRGQLRFHSY